MNKLYVLVGVPGSGKTTWVNNQDWVQEFAYISTDKYVDEYAKQMNKTYSEVFAEYMPTAVNLMTEEVIEARESCKDIIWDQTSTTIQSRKKKFRMLPDYYTIAIVFKTPDDDELNRRLLNRPGKIIPDQIMKDLIIGWQPPSENEGFKEIWYV